ncbi:hypothetical protein A3B50_00725 [Candidatus Roizmanbacteria bacterium RIFCSPLOWO2_01_FULL_40_42]|uniref:Metallo-beta-lactamase domain-containing protein n=1 Tax=Candidatus Roizmanbacteria bacterium RIFCSPLOWO2_01_FULL_40_42 TaxID=1802066 RepID=A0A1F7J517_9BACT|nr:MAG: hypothetical protein A3C31_02270 [Candidatus Roizmanbacteria bacterium RIFCSPHIGHO2_02_FULL_40_53]OGK36314.1 MAG: hypothetical protein A3E69_03715 [Candidatus Roizmanbacteria bacterium RIFCSPHIGHO2_12_FULL_40_130]OGK50686.1 MAG: hypothetical protein A3B50_00725 [Candidatus Roizmanbacteria bacterium RIFCSPLOWO2_01_FULL_40_42]OGK59215.1 MAG: hypothetical protein A3H84_03570 [Candidatus Roizmanbacteria bacterium RIFCSPLOWO2_02_FULL_40_13]
MKIFSYPLGELQANCYFLVNDKECIIIDPGDSADFILEKIQIENLKVHALFATHGHFDHVMAAGELQMSLKAPFYIADEDLFLLKRVTETARHFLGHVPAIIQPKETKNLKGGKMKIESFEFEVIEVPGHTPGSRCFYFKDEKTIFTGDTLFKEAIGRYDFSYSDKSLLRESLEKLYLLPEDTLVYAGHGDITTIGEEAKRRII